MLRYKPNLKKFAQNLRRTSTETEVVFWSRIRRKQVLGFQFYRQKPVGPYIVDFYCPRAKLIIEIDGSQHFEEKNEQKDKERDTYLQALGFTVLRFNNTEVCQNVDSAVEMVFDFLDNIKTPSS